MTFLSLTADPVLAIADCYDNSTTPIPICSCIDLQNVTKNKTAFYHLQNDMNCSNTSTWSGGQAFANREEVPPPTGEDLGWVGVSVLLLIGCVFVYRKCQGRHKYHRHY